MILIVFLFLLFFIFNSIKGQKIKQSVGIGVEGLLYRNFSERNLLVAGSLHYYPKVNLIATKNSSLSVGAPLSAGLAWVGSISQKYAFFYRLPVAVDFNFGRNSSGISETKAGGYLGLGFETIQVFSDELYRQNNPWLYGPSIRAGFRTPFGGAKSLTFNFQYRFGLEWPTKHAAAQTGMAFDF